MNILIFSGILAFQMLLKAGPLSLLVRLKYTNLTENLLFPVHFQIGSSAISFRHTEFKVAASSYHCSLMIAGRGTLN
jgi:hypothetical protein